MTRRPAAFTLSLAVAAAVLSPSALAQTASAARPITTALQVPFEGSVPGACQGDIVPIKGSLNVVTRVRLGAPGPKGTQTQLDVYLNLNDVKGVGSASGLRYLGLGTAQLSTMTDPGAPHEPSYRVNFMLWAVGRAANACVGDQDQVQPLPVKVTLKFDPDGSLSAVLPVVQSPGR